VGSDCEHPEVNARDPQTVDLIGELFIFFGVDLDQELLYFVMLVFWDVVRTH
jgi:hypothetical protein